MIPMRSVNTTASFSLSRPSRGGFGNPTSSLLDVSDRFQRLRVENGKLLQNAIEKHDLLESILFDSVTLEMEEEKEDLEEKEKNTMKERMEIAKLEAKVRELSEANLAATRKCQEKTEFVRDLQERLSLQEATLMEASLKENDVEKEKLREENRELRKRLTMSECQKTVSRDQVSQMRVENGKLEKLLRRLKVSHLSEVQNRRLLHNKLMEMKENIRVFCRVRPIVRGIDPEGSTSTDHIKLFKMNYGKIQIIRRNRNVMNTKTIKKTSSFNFDQVFAPDASQEKVFEEVSLLTRKTYTMEGEGREKGIIPRTIKQVFGIIKTLEMNDWKFFVRVSFLEIYNETLGDLLDSKIESQVSESFLESPVKLEIVHNEKTHRTKVTNLKTVLVRTPEEVMDLLKVSQKNRKIAATKCNDRSSRSHSVFTIKIKGKRKKKTRIGFMHLIDLAGSERLSVSGSDGERLVEVKHINKSLSCLSNVISSLLKKNTTKKKQHIPLRDSKLTFFLQNSLQGDTKTLMICNVSPCLENMNETLNALRFSSKANSVKMNKN